MAYINLFVELEISPSSNYIYIKNYIVESYIEEAYKISLESSKQFGIAEKFEVFEGYKLRYIHLENVKFDGRKRKVSNDDILKSLESQGYAKDTGAKSIFNGYYIPTNKLTNTLDEQLNERKQLISEGKYIMLKEVV